MGQSTLSVQTDNPAITDLQTRVIHDLDEFHAIADEWNGLIERASGDPIFMSQAWLTTWWECFGSGKQLHIIAVYQGPDLIGAAPLMVTTTRMYGMKVRRLEAIYNVHTPRFDFLIADRHDDVYRVIWNELSRAEDKWDAIVLAQLPTSSPTFSVMQEFASSAGWRTGRWEARPSPYIQLGCEFDAFLNRIKGKERYNLRKRQSRLAEIGAIELEVIRDAHQVRGVMEDGLRIEAAAWKGENGTAMISDPDTQEFYTRFAERAAELGWLRLCFLRVGGKRVAFDYAIEHGGKICGVKIGYDPEYHTFSPGHLLLLLILQQACRTRCSEYDFLGVDDEWKLSFTKDTRLHNWAFLFPNRPRSTFLHAAKFRIIPWAKNRRLLGSGRV